MTHNATPRRLTINTSLYPDAEALHRYIAEKLRFPSYYGRNLDALYDVLSTNPGCLILYWIEDLRLALGLDPAMGRRFLAVFEDLRAEHRHILVIRIRRMNGVVIGTDATMNKRNT